MASKEEVKIVKEELTKLIAFISDHDSEIQEKSDSCTADDPAYHNRLASWPAIGGKDNGS